MYTYQTNFVQSISFGQQTCTVHELYKLYKLLELCTLYSILYVIWLWYTLYYNIYCGFSNIQLQLKNMLNVIQYTIYTFLRGLILRGEILRGEILREVCVELATLVLDPLPRVLSLPSALQSWPRP